MREFELLEHVYEASRHLPSAVEVGPGDDMAVLRLAGGPQLLVAVDQVVDGRHVHLASTPLHLVGRKAVTRSLSDVAAMAARPVAALVAVTLPPEFGRERARDLFDAMRNAGAEYDCPLVGGDIAFHAEPGHPLVCSVTVLAAPGSAGPITRGGARVGDRVFVTGAIGGSLIPADDGPHHLTFAPRIVEGLELARILGPRLHAMIDVSDGLGRDAGHLARAGGVRVEIDAARIPCRHELPWRRAAGDGEDYELLFAADGPVPEMIGNGVPVSPIGRISDGTSGTVVIIDGEAVLPAESMGWEHAT